MKDFSEWENFYVIVGSSAGSLIGLQFLLISLMANLPQRSDMEKAGRAFATPTVVHFTAVLLLAASGTVPWREPGSAAVAWGIGGIAGALYELFVIRQMLHQKVYRPEMEDWIFHVVLPLVADALLVTAAWTQRGDLHRSLLVVAAVMLLFLVVGIHNAWDAATYNVFNLNAASRKAEPEKPQREGQDAA